MMLLRGMTKVEEKEEKVEWDSAPDNKISKASNKRYHSYSYV